MPIPDLYDGGGRPILDHRATFDHRATYGPTTRTTYDKQSVYMKTNFSLEYHAHLDSPFIHKNPISLDALQQKDPCANVLKTSTR